MFCQQIEIEIKAFPPKIYKKKKLATLTFDHYFYLQFLPIFYPFAGFVYSLINYNDLLYFMQFYLFFKFSKARLIVLGQKIQKKH